MKAPRQITLLLVLLSALILPGFADAPPGIRLNDSNLRAERIDTDETEFFLSHAMDFSGRLYVGGREALFVYELTAKGGFGARKELYRFPKDTWLYDLEVYGDDLFVITNTALYRIPQIADQGSTLEPEKILWGAPLGHHHQGLHAIEFGPEGDLYFSFGDPQPHLHWDRDRPDHLWHWTFYVGPENTPYTYNGVGAVMRLRLSDFYLSVHSSGLRNPCGISFDPEWRLFVNDNDQEGGIASPCKLVFAPAHSWQGWVRGWAARHNPKRLDMLPVANLQLDVPVGQCWYDDSVLGEQYRGSVMVGNWGDRTVSWYKVAPEGAGFTAPTEILLQGEGIIRPVSAMPTNDGRLIVSVCYMQGNEGSPVRRTDLLLISPSEGEFQNRDYSKVPLRSLLNEPWQLAAKAHQEILRQGGSVLDSAAADFLTANPADTAFSSLIFLAAKSGRPEALDRIRELAESGGPNAAIALRAAARFPRRFPSIEVGQIATPSQDPQTLLALMEYVHAARNDISPTVVEFATHDDAFVRQSAVRFLAKHVDQRQLREWNEGDAEQHLVAVLTAGFRIWDGAEAATTLPADGSRAPAKQLNFSQADGDIRLGSLGRPIGIFTLVDWWSETPHRSRFTPEFNLLKRGLADADNRVNTAAAVFLYFLNEDDVDPTVLALLRQENIDLRSRSERLNPNVKRQAERALADATLPTENEIPAAFVGINWEQAAAEGDPSTGKKLFTERGCIACHLSPDDRRGGSIGPSLFGVTNRFTPTYLAESMLVPNRAVSPNFHPVTLTLKDGSVHTGFIDAENNGEINLRVVTGQTVNIPAAEVAHRAVSQQSMMPAGLIQTPEEMSDMLSYLTK